MASETLNGTMSMNQSHQQFVDLKHMTSNSVLLTPPKDIGKYTHRPSQHLQTSSARLGSRSPNSIPSSPTSIHSSSSAIFERDIEPICPSPPRPSHVPDPHRMPRAKGTEQLEQNVPSVLDSAAAILTSSSPEDEEHIAIVAPATDTGYRSGVASPIGSVRSRSPSPTRSATRASLLLSVPTPSTGLVQPMSIPQVARSLSPNQKRPVVQTSLPTSPPVSNVSSTSGQPPSVSTPTSAYYSTLSSARSSPTTTTMEHAPEFPPDGSSPSGGDANAPVETPQSPAVISINSLSRSDSMNASPLSAVGLRANRIPSSSHPPSPTHGPTKRLSFMSYSDLLASTPASMLPLSSLTSSASLEPPPHIPSVYGFPQAQSIASSIVGGTHSNRDSVALLDGIGGEWEREGLGKGLEERLEALMPLHGKA